MAVPPQGTDTSASPEYGWGAYTRGRTNQPLNVALGLVVPLGVGALAAWLAELWVHPENVTLALTVSVALLAIAFTPEVSDLISHSGDEPRDGDENAKKNRGESARWFIAIWSLFALVAIFAHIVTKEVDDTADGSRRDISFDATVELDTKPFQITAESVEADSGRVVKANELVKVVIERGERIPELGRTHHVIITSETRDRDFAETIRDLLRHLAVGLTIASFGWWVASRRLRGLITAPAPPVLPSSRLASGALHLVIPAIALVGLMVWWDRYFDTWWRDSLVALAVLVVWQLVRTNIGSPGSNRYRRMWIISTRRNVARTDSPPRRWQLALRALILGSCVAFPVGVFADLINAAQTGEIADLPPYWTVAVCLIPAGLLVLSLPAHPRGQAFHDLLSWTAVRPASGEDGGSPDQEPTRDDPVDEVGFDEINEILVDHTERLARLEAAVGLPPIGE